MSEGENEKRERDESAPRVDDEPRGEAPPSESAQEDHAEDHGDGREGIHEELLEELKAQVFESDGDDLAADAEAEGACEERQLAEEDGVFERGSSAELAEASHQPERAQEDEELEQTELEDEELEDEELEDDDSEIEGEDLALPGDDDEARGPGLESALHLEPSRRKSVIESVIFVADKPINERQIAQKLGLELDDVRAAVAELIEEYAERGVRLDRISGGLLFRTSVDNAPFVRKMKAPPPVRMTRAQLETLSIVAYRQPVTRPEVDEIRGVDSGSALKVLADRELVRILGRKEEPGRPLLYGTTTFFLEFFGLNSLRDLPTLKEFSDLNEESRSLFERKMGEPIDMRAIQEEAEAAEAAMQDELLQQFPDEDEEDQGDERDGGAAPESEEAAPKEARSGDDLADDEGDEWDAEEGEESDDGLDDDDDLDDDDLDDDDLDDDDLDDDDEGEGDDDEGDDDLDDDDLDDDDLDDDDLDDDDLDDDDLDDEDQDDEDDEEWDADEDEEDARGEDTLDDDPESDHVKSGAPEPDEGDDDPLPPRARDDADSPSLSDDFDDDDFEDDDPDEDVFENPDFDDDDDWDDEDDDDDWDDEED